MDELTLIRDFSLSERSASAAERDRARAGLLAHASRASRPRVARRPWVVALAAALLLLLTGTAFAFGPLRDIFVGEPAPPKVKQGIAGFNEFHESLIREGLGGVVVRSEDATGLIKFRSGELPLRVWTAPLVDGGSCTFVEIPGERFLKIGPCTAPVNVQPPVLYAVEETRRLGMVSGHVTDDVARLDARFPSGRVRHLPLVDGFFATGFPPRVASVARDSREYDALIAHQKREAQKSTLPAGRLQAHQADEWDALERRQAARRASGRPVELIAFDASGHQIASEALVVSDDGPTQWVPFASPAFYKGMHGLLQINTPIGAPATMILRGKDDKHCDTIWFANLGAGGCGGGALSTSSAPGLVLLDGSAGEDAASAEIRYSDGQTDEAYLLEGRFLVALTDTQFARAGELVVRDASGQVIRTISLDGPFGG